MFEKYRNRSGNKFVPVPLPNKETDLHVSDDGQVVSLKSGQLPLQINHRGEHVIWADLYNGPGEYLVSMLVLLGYKKLDPDFPYLDKVVPFHIDGDTDNLHPGNIGYRFNDPLESLKSPGWFYIPFFTNYVVNLNGDVYNERRGYPIGATITKPSEAQAAKNIRSGYVRYALYNDLGQFNLGRHRAMMLTFTQYPNWVDKLDVNHINGVPGDDWLDNLEWATRSENNLHAVNSGLRSQNRKCYVKNVFSGKEFTFHSQAQAANKTGCIPTDLVKRLRQNQKVYPGGWMYKLDANIPWREVGDPVKEIESLPIGTKVYSKNIATNEIRLHDSLQQCAIDLGFSSIHAAKQQLRNGRNQPYYGYLFKLVSDNTPWPEFTETEIKRFLEIGTGRARPVVAKNELGEIVERFSSIHQACERYKEILRKPNDVIKAILRKRKLNGITLHYDA